MGTTLQKGPLSYYRDHPPFPPQLAVTDQNTGKKQQRIRIIQVVKFLAQSTMVCALHLVQISSSKYGWASIMTT